MKRYKELFVNTLERMVYRDWEKIYVMVDIHDTIFRGCYREKEYFEWLGESKSCLQQMTQNPYICLILWSSVHDNELARYLKEFDDNGITFDYINSNPEVDNTDLASFQKKFYFNIGLDDKFGFCPSDWADVKEGIDEFMKKIKVIDKWLKK